ncbi:MAG: efflux transporter outer membrane subunit, partial [Caulobacteraceae bacterium]
MTYLTKILVCAGAAAVLTGCAHTVGPNFQAPAAPATPGYAMAGDRPPAGAAAGERIAGDWWTLFHSADLDATMRQAIVGNQTLEAARATLAQAQHAVDAQDPKLRIDANANVTHERINFASFGLTEFPGATGPIENPTVTLFSFGANARYDFDLFGQHRRETEALVAREQ